VVELGHSDASVVVRHGPARLVLTIRQNKDCPRGKLSCTKHFTHLHVLKCGKSSSLDNPLDTGFHLLYFKCFLELLAAQKKKPEQ